MCIHSCMRVHLCSGVPPDDPGVFVGGGWQVGSMIQAEPDVQRREEYLQHLMGPPNLVKRNGSTCTPVEEGQCGCAGLRTGGGHLSLLWSGWN